MNDIRLHTLKIHPEYYWHVLNGYKTFELRKNDRDYKTFDLIHFVDTNGQRFINDPNNVYQITYVLKDVPGYGLNEEYCILSIVKINKE